MIDFERQHQRLDHINWGNNPFLEDSPQNCFQHKKLVFIAKESECYEDGFLAWMDLVRMKSDFQVTNLRGGADEESLV